VPGALATGLVACRSDLASAPVTAGAGETVTNPTRSGSGSNPLASFTFYIDEASNARKTANEWRTTRPPDAVQMEKIASQPVAKWFGGWNGIAGVRSAVATAVSTIAATGATPIFVAYNIPQRDCGGLSGSNSLSPDGYRSWITEFARGLGSSPAIVILEPDALAAMDCLSADDQQTRVGLIRFALDQLNADGNARVYLDAGHARWQSAQTMSSRLSAAGIAAAAGFSLNVSNFISDADNVQFGTQLSSLVGGKHFIIDSGRNGLGPTADLQWCNPEGRAIGRRPTTNTGNALVDAYLWIKVPGESDGACNGNPASGTWMPEYALGLAVRG